jgi:hypothetical protein
MKNSWIIYNAEQETVNKIINSVKEGVTLKLLKQQGKGYTIVYEHTEKLTDNSALYVGWSCV